MFKNGVDQGYKEHQDWWSREGDPDRYRYADLDIDYPMEYFPLADPGNAKEFADTVMSYYSLIMGDQLRTLVEFGSAGGWYLKAFMRRNVHVRGYEGSAFGVATCLSNGIPGSCVDVKDFRYPMPHYEKKYQLAICTEVAEHVEPSFHGVLVHNLIQHSSLIWFSSEAPNTNRAHLHHPGEQPLEYWQALFNFFDFGCYMLPDDVFRATNERGRCLFFNRKHIKL